ncbi:MAG: hypothetical protein RMN25_10380 [Anaerolineae bacterium]|nr:hypothetical protein [Thermoflexales bacterium]MDW8408172.1 hypothetical protein [Anaerolineae bacterium]
MQRPTFLPTDTPAVLAALLIMCLALSAMLLTIGSPGLTVPSQQSGPLNLTDTVEPPTETPTPTPTNTPTLTNTPTPIPTSTPTLPATPPPTATPGVATATPVPLLPGTGGDAGLSGGMSFAMLVVLAVGVAWLARKVPFVQRR